jgi:N-acetyl-anhydromuramyl-L-alanine amidase AmpD
MRTALIISAALAGCAVPADGPSQATRSTLGGESSRATLFTRVANETGVPADVLAAVSYVETRLSFANGSDVHQVGPLAITDGIAGPRDLHRGASLAGVTNEAARTDYEASLRAGAALLRDAAKNGDYALALRTYGGESLAREVMKRLARGIDARDDEGKRFVIPARRFDVGSNLSTISQGLGYSGAEWQPAYSGNYQSASRGLTDVKYIVIHDTEGSYSGTLSWFKNPDANVSAHYVVRSSDGHIAQMVDEKNIAWHDACWNTNSVGIEHEGYAAKPDQWYTEAMYTESAKLTAYLADKYNIKKTHSTSTIMGHGEAPDCSDHSDPGPGWNWPHYMDLVQTGGAPSFKGEDIVVVAPDSIQSGEVATVTVTLTNTGNAAWDLDATRIGTTDPQDRNSDFFVEGDWLATNRATAVDARTDADTAGTFTFQIKGPDVKTPTVYDEAFSFVQEGVTWFGPTFHVVLKVEPAEDEGGNGGCDAGSRGSSGGLSGLLIALGLVVRRRRR